MAPDLSGDYDKKESLAGNNLRMPETRHEVLMMEQKICVSISCCSIYCGDIDMVRDESKLWASSMKAPRDMNEGSRISLKYQFCDFMCKGKNITDINHQERSANVWV
jgi:hypothetical protein